MRAIYSVSVGTDCSDLLRQIDAYAERSFGFPVERLAPADHPQAAFDARRRQYSADVVLAILCRTVPYSAVRLLAVTELDLFDPALSFVFGYARFKGPAAIVSTARMRPEFYRLPADRQLLAARVVKESLHELGHTFGLTHCREETCPMSLSTVILDVDTKQTEFCTGCAALLRELLRALHAGRAASVETGRH